MFRKIIAHSSTDSTIHNALTQVNQANGYTHTYSDTDELIGERKRLHKVMDDHQPKR